MWTRPYGGDGGRGAGFPVGRQAVVPDRLPPRPRPLPLTASPPYSLPTSVSSVASGGQAKRTGV